MANSDIPYDELQTVLSAQKGDKEAFRQIYARYVRYLTAVSFRYVLNTEDVKDILQESFIKIFASINSFKFKGPGSLKGWLTKIVVNETLKHLCKSKHLDVTDIAESEADIADEEPEVDEISSDLIYHLIRELPDGYRTIFNLYVIEGKTHKEIAYMLNIKESTSASQLHRAKAILASKINQFKHTLEHHSNER